MWTCLAAPVSALQQDQAEEACGRGIEYFGRHEFRKALQAFEECLEARPGDAGVLKLLGRAAVAAGEGGRAESAFARAVQADPADWESRYLLGRLFQSAGRLPQALAHLEEAARLPSRPARVPALLGTLYHGLGRTDEAARVLEESVLHNRNSERPDYVPELEYGAFLQRSGRLEESLEPLRSALQLSGGRSPEALLELARSLYRLGRLPHARSELEAGLKRVDPDPRLHHLLARVCYEQGDAECGGRHSRLSEELRGRR